MFTVTQDVQYYIEMCYSYLWHSLLTQDVLCLLTWDVYNYLRCSLLNWDVYSYLRCFKLPEMFLFTVTWDVHYLPEIGLWVQQSLSPGRDAYKHGGGGSWWGWGRGWWRHLLSCVNNRSISCCCETSVTIINNKNQID